VSRCEDRGPGEAVDGAGEAVNGGGVVNVAGEVVNGRGRWSMGGGWCYWSRGQRRHYWPDDTRIEIRIKDRDQD
jgi:hypothetical protein